MGYNSNVYNRSKGGKKWNRNDRPDHQPGARMQFERNRRKIIAAQSVCGICGQAVDKGKKYPDPWAPVVDHIIPVSRGGHPFELSNLQLAHAICNNKKGDKLRAEIAKAHTTGGDLISNQDLPLSIDWAHYRPTGDDLD